MRLDDHRCWKDKVEARRPVRKYLTIFQSGPINQSKCRCKKVDWKSKMLPGLHIIFASVLIVVVYPAALPTIHPCVKLLHKIEGWHCKLWLGIRNNQFPSCVFISFNLASMHFKKRNVQILNCCSMGSQIWLFWFDSSSKINFKLFFSSVGWVVCAWKIIWNKHDEVSNFFKKYLGPRAQGPVP